MPPTKRGGFSIAYTTIALHISLKTRRKKFREREYMKYHRAQH